MLASPTESLGTSPAPHGLSVCARVNGNHAVGVGLSGWLSQFLWVEFQAENMIRAWATPNGMNLVVSDLLLRGLPPDLDLNNKLKFELKGQLTVSDTHGWFCFPVFRLVPARRSSLKKRELSRAVRFREFQVKDSLFPSLSICTNTCSVVPYVP